MGPKERREPPNFVVSGDFVADEALPDEHFAIAEDPDNPQLVEILPDREAAERRAAEINAEHGNAPFLTVFRDDGEADLVQAEAIPFKTGRWGVYLVMLADAC